ncbi:MAG: Fe2+-dependent dioxygenase [Granulosicoccus sp.]|nr:Fe2+-dependent dioxygenase [Granulosicoccus sp.]
MLTTIDQVLSAEQLAFVHSAMESASWIDGSHSAGKYAQGRKANEEMDQSCSSWSSINQTVVSELYAHAEFQSSVLPSRVSAAFVSRCSPGMYYGIHVDDAVMGTASGRYRSDVAVTVFLNNPQDYTGGELRIHSRFGPVSVKGAAGSAVVYPASSRHEVTPVTDGQRKVCVLWAQSLVRDPAQREILADLDASRRALRLSAPEAQVTETVDHAYMNLVRMWAEV